MVHVPARLHCCEEHPAARDSRRIRFVRKRKSINLLYHCNVQLDKASLTKELACEQLLNKTQNALGKSALSACQDTQRTTPSTTRSPSR